MFKFNFSSDSPCKGEKNSGDEEYNNKTDIKWEESKLLDISSNPVSNIDLDAFREMNFNEISVKILKRELALVNIEKDLESPKYAIQADKSNSDLEPAKYEGGLKVWECSEDLAEYITKELGEKQLSGKDILDLGCGAGLIGIVALRLGANSVTFQDYNQEVLTHWTYPNVAVNFPQDQDTCKSRCKFWSGDWESFSTKCQDKFDFIFTSETIYNTNNYKKLYQIFKDHLRINSVVFLAAKSVYFSLGGSVQLFLSGINSKSKDFSSKIVFKSAEGVQRVIVAISSATT